MHMLRQYTNLAKVLHQPLQEAPVQKAAMSIDIAD